MSTISIAISTFNEAENIKHCLDSVKDWVDEIVLVDGSSTDETVKIAKEYKAKIIITGNPQIFHINKQKAIDACTSDWILQLDADERVTFTLKDEIRRAISSKQINGYWIPRKNYLMGKFLSKGGQYPDYSLRLYRNGKGKLPCESVHEQAVVNGEVAYLKNPLIHNPYPNFSHYLEHFDRYTNLLADEFHENKVRFTSIQSINYLLLKPIMWFLLTFIRHKGFMDGFHGFVFSLFSSLRFTVSYIKYWKKFKS